ncbi:hypothetical protein [Aquibacillus rhizosphaerae]|uniref:Uncharacterized protein n=1 Tax=Aquibacillus rhizosphaerae TaxID=3051431 RepID=A0ABT7LCG0_9BACI|nr:hypothetical protein [Aquibacillus sp. LR5S19]MDL4842947.1 hypothetical protein [Aquibacillus sp. LR5S19]
MLSKFHQQVIKNLRIFDKHLNKNEKWLQRPEISMKEFEGEITEWNRSFINSMNELEKTMGDYREERR